MVSEASQWELQCTTSGWERKHAERGAWSPSLVTYSTQQQSSTTFMQRLIELLSAFQCRDHWIRLNNMTRSYLCWWGQFMKSWNGVSNCSPSGNPSNLRCFRCMGLQSLQGHQMVPVAVGRPVIRLVIAPKELLFALIMWVKL